MSRGVKDYFEQVSCQWDTLRQEFYGDEVRNAVLKAAQVGPSDIVLDVGAGTGFLTEGAAKIARKVIALDFSESMTEEALSKLRGESVEFRIGDVEHMPLEDGSVDVVIGNMVLHHCPKPEVAISEMARVLVPGGRFALSDLQEHSFESLREDYADLWLGFKMAWVKRMLEAAKLENALVEPLASCSCSTATENGQVKIPMFLATAQKHL